MNCPFCQKDNPIDDEDSFGPFQVFFCYNCYENWRVEYCAPNDIVNYIGLFNGRYLIEITNSTTALYDTDNPPNNPDDHSCVRMNEAFDITPKNANYWVKKLLNLVVFS